MPTLREQLEIRDLLEVVEGLLAPLHLTVEDIDTRSQMRHLAAGRRAVYRYLHYELGWSWTAVGDLFGRHCTSIMEAASDGPRYWRKRTNANSDR